LAGIMGRISAQELRYDSSRLFRHQESSRALSLELRTRRKAWKEEEEVRLAMDQKRRVAEVTEKARQEAERQKRVQQKYERLAREEEERRRKEIEASRKQYEETQRKLDQEYQERLRKEQERREREERERQRKEQERREREERERQEELARKERERQEELARKERERQRKVQERRDAEKEMSKFAVRLEGTVGVSVPPAGTLLPGPMQEEATIRLEIQINSLLGGSGVPCERDFENANDLAAAAPAAVATAALSAARDVASALQLQKMSGEGPLMLMETPEVDHWIRAAAARTALNGLAALAGALETRHASSFDCRTESGILPPDHPLSCQRVYAQLLDRIVDDPGSLETAALFMEEAEEANAAFYRGVQQPSALKGAPRNLGVCIFLAHFVDRSLYARPAKESAAPAWFEVCAEFCRERLRESFAASPPDSLDPISSLVSVVLGGSHPIAVELAELAVRNVSSEQKIERERELARKARILASRLLEEEWPAEDELRKARARDREAKTPVTERIWALRNVASSLALGSRGEVGRARKLLEQAVILKQDLCESKEHPAVFPEALMLLKVIRGNSEWREDASGVASLFLKIATNISDGYVEAGDACSACIVLEMALKETEDAFSSLRNSATLRVVKKLEDLSKDLSVEDAQALVASRYNDNAGRVEDFLSDAFTDQLGAYQKDGVGTGRRKHEIWNEVGAEMLGKID
jgi:hypothetical protein